MNARDTELLQAELLRVTARGGAYGTFTAIDGSTFQGATETDVINHLTSKVDYVAGRQTRFPGIGNGWRFSAEIEAAGFVIRRGRNYRGQECSVVTL